MKVEWAPLIHKLLHLNAAIWGSILNHGTFPSCLPHFSLPISYLNTSSNGHWCHDKSLKKRNISLKCTTKTDYVLQCFQWHPWEIMLCDVSQVATPANPKQRMSLSDLTSSCQQWSGWNWSPSAKGSWRVSDRKGSFQHFQHHRWPAYRQETITRSHGDVKGLP